MKILLSICSLALLVIMASAYPNGAPTVACGDMVPLHGVGPQSSPSPYSITYSVEDKVYKVVVKASSGDSFKGFFLQARTPGTSNIIGAFTFSGSDVKYVDCSGGTNNAVTHTSNSEKTTVEVNWEPSTGFTGDVVFTLSTVRSKDVFWVRKESNTFTI
ncbi:unnamed protein product, partial [Meganyctiphanes norvegica]